ncbi:MAG TPA: hypothetical protein VK463_14525 [Desulfomonilaceae bacterium]|nr:hypothetical protein [Desulfomonilaceae bacterium]
MEFEEAFSRIRFHLTDARKRGIKPSVRSAGTDWVCTLEDEHGKFNIIAKDGELILVSARTEKREPDLDRINTSQFVQKDIVERIMGAIAEIYGG